MEKFFDSFISDFIFILLAYKFGTTEKDGETIILATAEQIKEETNKIYKMIYHIGE